MATLANSGLNEGIVVTTKRGGPVDRYFYFFMALLIPAVVVYGFSFTVGKNLIHPAIPRPPRSGQFPLLADLSDKGSVTLSTSAMNRCSLQNGRPSLSQGRTVSPFFEAGRWQRQVMY